MAAILSEIEPGDEVIVPAYTFVSTANAFALHGASIIFADSRPDHPGLDEESVERLVTTRTRAIVVMHYAGVACDMDKIMAIAHKYNLIVIEDAAHSVNSFYKGKPLGGIGHFGCFSFHETKNIQCGEGGMLTVNDERYFQRAEIIWEKGTNRVAFSRGEINNYQWIDLGSSFLPSELNAAFLHAQLENLEAIQLQRTKLWHHYYNLFAGSLPNENFQLAVVPEFSTNPGHIFYLIFNTAESMLKCKIALSEQNIMAITHYHALHKSPFGSKYVNRTNPVLMNAERYEATLLRLPLYYELKGSDIERIVDIIIKHQD